MLNIDDRLIKEVSPKIRPNALSVLLAIAIHLNKQSGRCFPSHKRLMDLTGLGRDAVYNALDVLKKEKLLKSNQPIDSKNKTFGRRTFTVSTRFISIFVVAEDAEPLPENPYTDEPYTEEPDTASQETQPLNQSELINQLEQLNKEGEGTLTPAPNPSNLQSQKKEEGKVAQPRLDPLEKMTWQEEQENVSNFYAKRFKTVKAENPPSKKVAPKKDSPGGNYEPSEFDRYGVQPLEILEGETLAEFEERMTTITIHDPSLPNVTLVEAVEAKKLSYSEYPNPKNSKELRERLAMYFSQNDREWTDGVLEQGKAVNWPLEKIRDCMTMFCAHQEAENNFRRTYGQYKGMLVKWFLNQPRHDSFNAPASGGSARNGNGRQSEKSTSPASYMPTYQ